MRGEVGDGEISLTWYVPEHNKEHRPVRYTVSYHSEGDKTEKKQEKIKGSPYKLRGLKNGVTHYVRVAGYGEDGKEVASSDELDLVPLSVDDMASPIERSFARGLSAMAQKADGEEVKWNLKQFGYDFFSNAGSSSYDNLPWAPIAWWVPATPSGWTSGAPCRPVTTWWSTETARSPSPRLAPSRSGDSVTLNSTP